MVKVWVIHANCETQKEMIRADTGIRDYLKIYGDPRCQDTIIVNSRVNYSRGLSLKMLSDAIKYSNVVVIAEEYFDYKEVQDEFHLARSLKKTILIMSEDDYGGIPFV